MRLRRVNLGDIVTWDGRDWIVDAHGIQGTRLNPVVEGSPVWVDLATVALEASFEHHQKSDASQEVRERIDLARLDQDTHQDVLFWRNHLNEARFGVADPDDPDAVPRDGYGAGTTIEGRMELKAQELRDGLAVREIGGDAFFEEAAEARTGPRQRRNGRFRQDAAEDAGLLRPEEF